MPFALRIPGEDVASVVHLFDQTVLVVQVVNRSERAGLLDAATEGSYLKVTVPVPGTTA